MPVKRRVTGQWSFKQNNGIFSHSRKVQEPLFAALLSGSNSDGLILDADSTLSIATEGTDRSTPGISEHPGPSGHIPEALIRSDTGFFPTDRVPPFKADSDIGFYEPNSLEPPICSELFLFS